MEPGTFKITTNSGVFYVEGFTEKQINDRAIEYLHQWRDKGNSIGSAIYKWRKIEITSELP